MITVHNLGYPRIGRNREMKFAIEGYWKGHIEKETLLATARSVRKERWETQAEAGVEFIPVGDAPFYDHVLQMSLVLGVIPNRFKDSKVLTSAFRHDLEFAIARGTTGTSGDIEPSSMTKWFDTNYHYIVPELEWERAVSSAETVDAGDASAQFTPDATVLVDEAREVRELGYKAKPVLVGPLSYLWLSGAAPELAGPIARAYAQITRELAPYADWIQFDEPILNLDLPESWRQAFGATYATLASAVEADSALEVDVPEARSTRLMVATYFGPLEENMSVLTALPVQGIHIDAVRAPQELEAVAQAVAAKAGGKQVLSVGIINGRNVWKNNLESSLKVLAPMYQKLGDRLWIAPSCSLLHVPVDAAAETQLAPGVRASLAFADQKLHELAVLKRAVEQGAEALEPEQEEYRRNEAALAAQRGTADPGTGGQQGFEVKEHEAQRAPYELRRHLHQHRFSLPLFPTTTIGSFPQTDEIRRARRARRKGEIAEWEYTERIRAEIERTVRIQEDIGLDVLVHGEAERTDMVEYFGRRLEGFAFTELGWVQSYGTRCVKPPIIFGTVKRPEPMTVFWTAYAQSLTERPVKGMLTGPITILQWSFVREDQPRRDTAMEIAQALRDEVRDLEQAGIGIIQVDEPALREGLPLRKSGWNEYLNWATLAFRFATSGVTNQTQIHTHMCYSQFNEIIEAIAALDADVITIEAARSQMRLLDAFESFEYPNEIGPGIYDIHSPLVPSVDGIVELLERALERVPAERLWVNPDCGLKTRSWSEVEPALRNMVSAAQQVRARQPSLTTQSV